LEIFAERPRVLDHPVLAVLLGNTEEVVHISRFWLPNLDPVKRNHCNKGPEGDPEKAEPQVFLGDLAAEGRGD